MPKIIDTQQITSEKSTFLIDIVKSDHGKLYVELGQSINATKEKLMVAKINPEVLTDIIASLQYCHSIINVTTTLDKNHIDNAKDIKIRDYYFKNVPIKEIAKLLNVKEK